MEGYNQRREEGLQRDAWMLANLLTPHTKKNKKLKPEDFIQGEKSSKPTSTGGLSRQEELERLQKKLGLENENGNTDDSNE